MTKMSKEADEILKSLEDMVAHIQGKDVGAITSTVQVPIVNVHRARDSLGLTQKQFAQTFGVSISTVRNWEQGRRAPSGAAKVLLNVIEQSPETVKRALVNQFKDCYVVAPRSPIIIGIARRA